jgi:hypothetical protein
MKSHSMRAFALSCSALLGLALFAFYLWGKIQIDFAVRKNAGLQRQCESLQHDIDDLRVDINHLKSYQRVTDKAQELGLVFLGSDQIEELPVDLSGLRRDSGSPVRGTVLAQQSRKESMLSIVLGGNHGTR